MLKKAKIYLKQIFVIIVKKGPRARRSPKQQFCDENIHQTVMYEKTYQAVSRLAFHTELFEAYIVPTSLPLNFIVGLPETVRF